MRQNKIIVTYNSIFENLHTIGNYTTCFHELDLTKTITNFSIIQLAKEGEFYNETFTLQIKHNNLYNYDIGKDKISFKLKNSSVD